ncbi:MAG: hypothetical protein EOO77_16565 [Oxalobacteraceae bacterium]|nr:MAG: hypothetical protein EOO77_16565 [Oxalobacteraceae bacterium]
MLKLRMRRLAARGDHATERLAGIRASIKILDDEDVLDLADIFRAMPSTVLGQIVQAEMTRRGISL